MYNASNEQKYTGVMVDLMDRYSELLGFKYEIVRHVYVVENFGASASKEEETIVDVLRNGVSFHRFIR